MADNNRISPNMRSNKKGKKRRKKTLISFLLLIFLTGAGYAGYVAYHAYNAVDKSYAKVKGREEKSELREAPVYISSDPFSILLLGIENYTDEFDKGRSDTIMVATFNPKQQTMKLLSVPRDTLVKIPGKTKKNKINAAYAFGGKELTIKTVEQLLDIPIDYYVTVNFNGFKNIVDDVGGVTVKVPFDFDDINSKWERFYFHEGKQKLNGEEALVYARMRMKDPRGDFGRNDRQRQIVAALVDELSSPKTLLRIDKISDEIGDNVETNMRVSEALAFRKKYTAFDSSRIEQLQIKGYDDTMRGVYYFVPDEDKLEEIKASLKSHLGLSDDTANTDENDQTTDETLDSNEDSSNQ
ncbi:LCP family protein [Neobacillus drentensis]|uniref:LCP family protein n=1 Tax=Neobacillus drentensis TaxID=220684 RepID=UPI002FFFD693